MFTPATRWRRSRAATGPVIGRLSCLVAAAVLTAGMLAGCSSEGAGTDCDLDQCTITFDRGAEASASVLGVSVELVSATDGEATVSVGGREATVPVEGSRDVAGMTVAVRDITADEVVVQVTR